MRKFSESFDIEDLMSYGEDLINLLNAKNGFDVLSQSFEQLKALNFACDEDFNQKQGSIEGYKKKLDACKKKLEEAYSDVAAGDEIERLQKEIEKEIALECKPKDELRVVADDLKDQNAQRKSIEEHVLFGTSVSAGTPPPLKHNFP